MTPDLPDNVIAIETKFTEAPPVDWKPRDWLGCQHEAVILDETLHIVSCRNCGEDRLDPFEVLMGLARRWRRWHEEAEQLRKLRAEYQTNERAKWERARDRHLGANPSHVERFVPGRAGYRWPDNGEPTQPCLTCYRLEVRWDRRWEPRRAPEPPPGKLEPA